MSERLNCIVPFCKRTTGKFEPTPPDNCWVCSKHWAMGSKELKARKRRLRRLQRKKPGCYWIDRELQRVSRLLTEQIINGALGNG